MAGLTSMLAAVPHANEILTDDQINALLDQAAERSQTGQLQQKGKGSAARYNFPRLSADGLETSSLVTEDKVTRIREDSKAKHADIGGYRKVEDPVLVKSRAKEAKTATAGSGWYDLPKTNLTPELKRDLQLLKMRNVLDPHRHYKKDNGKMSVPEYSQVGTIVEGATEFYSGRLENKKRKRTFVEEVLAGEQETGRFRRKYGEAQDKKASGKKSFYKDMKAKRKNGVKKGG